MLELNQSILFNQLPKLSNHPNFCVFLNLFLEAQMCRELQGLAVTSAYLPHCRARGQRLSVGGEGQLCSSSPGIPGWEEKKGVHVLAKERMISVAGLEGFFFFFLKKRTRARYLHALASSPTIFSSKPHCHLDDLAVFA